jgi:hypothetical protein
MYSPVFLDEVSLAHSQFLCQPYKKPSKCLSINLLGESIVTPPSITP